MNGQISLIVQAGSAPVSALPVIAWRETRVITTELLAREYETDEVRIRQNFDRNSARFVEGKHFYRLEGGDLRDFKNRVSQSYSVGKNARSLILWTERGAARHAKMLDTDAAWEVFERLEDCYFRVKEIMESPAERARLRHEAVGIHKAMNSVLVRRRENDGKECAAHHFMNEAKLISHVLIGKFKGMDRNSLTLEQLGMLAKLEMQNTILIAEGMSYRDRKIKLEQFALALMTEAAQIATNKGAQA